MSSCKTQIIIRCRLCNAIILEYVAYLKKSTERIELDVLKCDCKIDKTDKGE
jgi:hypothetical protein